MCVSARSARVEHAWLVCGGGARLHQGRHFSFGELFNLINVKQSFLEAREQSERRIFEGFPVKTLKNAETIRNC